MYVWSAGAQQLQSAESECTGMISVLSHFVMVRCLYQLSKHPFPLFADSLVPLQHLRRLHLCLMDTEVTNKGVRALAGMCMYLHDPDFCAFVFVCLCGWPYDVTKYCVASVPCSVHQGAEPCLQLTPAWM